MTIFGDVRSKAALIRTRRKNKTQKKSPVCEPGQGGGLRNVSQIHTIRCFDLVQ